MLAASLSATIAGVFLLAKADGFPVFSQEGALLLAAVCVFSPLHTGLAKGNLSVLAAALASVAVAASLRSRPRVAAIAAGVAALVKPQVGVVALVYFAMTGDRRTASIAAGLAGGVTIVAGVWLTATTGGLAWFEDWTHIVQATFAAGGINDSTAMNPVRYHLLNPQWPLATLAGDGFISRWGPPFVTAIAGGWLWVTGRRNAAGPHGLLPFAALAALSLLPAYRRSYDAVLLLPGLVWCMQNWAGPARRHARVALFGLLAFATPGAAMLTRLSVGAGLAGTLDASLLWTAAILPHQVWALCVIALCLVSAAITESRRRPAAVLAGQPL
jgi:hypothetical protein